MPVRSLSQEGPLEEEMATHSSILAWEISWTGEPGGVQSMGLRRVRQDCARTHTSRGSGSGRTNKSLQNLPIILKCLFLDSVLIWLL